MKGQILVQNLSKSYFSYSRESRRILSWLGLPFKADKKVEILKNISLKIGTGESVGIIGQNGAGKSTLLKILAGTTTPTSGEFKLHGKIAAILELGMGFNTEFSGRENSYHAATLMGYSKQEIDAVIDNIKSFSEIGDYFEQPLRTYSSGMQMRVAFAVATAYRPDFLIVDEALSVGDTYFQHKSYAKIREFRHQGTTVLFVSHDRNAISGLCQRAILLEKGQIIKDGPAEVVLDFYNALIAERETSNIKQHKTDDRKLQTISGSKEATVTSVGFIENGLLIDSLQLGQKVRLQAQVKATSNISQLVFGFSIRDKFGQIMYGTNTFLKEKILTNVTTGNEFSFTFDFDNNLGIGEYSISTSLHRNLTHIDGNIEWVDQAYLFKVVDSKDRDFEGMTNLKATANVQRTTSAQ